MVYSSRVNSPWGIVVSLWKLVFIHLCLWRRLLKVWDNNPHRDTSHLGFAWNAPFKTRCCEIGRCKCEQKDMMRFHHEKDMIQSVCTVWQSGQGRKFSPALKSNCFKNLLLGPSPVLSCQSLTLHNTFSQRFWTIIVPQSNCKKVKIQHHIRCRVLLSI